MKGGNPKKNKPTKPSKRGTSLKKKLKDASWDVVVSFLTGSDSDISNKTGQKKRTGDVKTFQALYNPDQIFLKSNTIELNSGSENSNFDLSFTIDFAKKEMAHPPQTPQVSDFEDGFAAYFVNELSANLGNTSKDEYLPQEYTTEYNDTSVDPEFYINNIAQNSIETKLSEPQIWNDLLQAEVDGSAEVDGPNGDDFDNNIFKTPLESLVKNPDNVQISTQKMLLDDERLNEVFSCAKPHESNATKNIASSNFFAEKPSEMQQTIQTSSPQNIMSSQSQILFTTDSSEEDELEDAKKRTEQTTNYDYPKVARGLLSSEDFLSTSSQEGYKYNPSNMSDLLKPAIYEQINAGTFFFHDQEKSKFLLNTSPNNKEDEIINTIISSVLFRPFPS